MKKNKLISFFLIGMCAMMLGGCNKEETQNAVEVQTEEEDMFGLTENEQKVYAEYAAGVLMKYNAGTDMRILEGQTLIDQEAKEQAEKEQAAKREQAAAEYEANKKNDNKNNVSHSSNGSLGSNGESGISYISDMSEATGTEAFSVIYDGYEITDSYPNSGNDILMAMDASTGKYLLVTKYKVTNISGQTENFDMFSKKAKFRLSLNGKRYKSQYTLLLDDLSMFKGDIEAGETIDTVLIFEIPETEASSINDMILSVTVDEKSGSMQLSGGSSVMWTENVEPIESEAELEAEQKNDNNDLNTEEINLENNDEDINDSEYNDLAEEYLNAIEIENAELDNSDNNTDKSGGNVTVVGSNRN